MSETDAREVLRQAIRLRQKFFGPLADVQAAMREVQEHAKGDEIAFTVWLTPEQIEELNRG